MKKLLWIGLALCGGWGLSFELRGDVVISEFMASNVSTVVDEDGEAPDWIEVWNSGASAVDLGGWSLTDTPANPQQWRFPSTNLPPGSALLVFASGKNRRIAGAPLHTNFRLNVGGDYLALVGPDGVTVASSFAPLYPPQVTDVSYGLDPWLRVVSLLATNARGRLLVPTDGSLGTNWVFPAFNDGSWQTITSAVGYVVGALDRLPVVGLTNGLMSYWKFDEASGTTAAEATGRGTSGTLVNFPANNSQWGPGRNDGAVRFRGSPANDYIRVANYPRASNALTMAAWVYAEGRPVWASIAKNWAASGGQFHFGLRDTGGDLDIFINTSAGQFSLRENTQLPLNQWQHVAFTADGSTLRLFRNGQQVASTPYAGTFIAPPVPSMGIGVKLDNSGTVADAGAPGYWQGRIDDLALWHRALGGSEIQAIASAGGTGGFPLGTDARLPLLGVNAGAWLRFPFTVDNPELMTRWRLKVRYDDGFAAWLNGEEVVRRNAPDPLEWNSTGTASGTGPEFEEFNLSEFTNVLVPGTNVLAIHALNANAADLDFFIQPSLEASLRTETTNALVYFTTPTPGVENSVGVSVLGPIIKSVKHVPAIPRGGDDLLVTARVAPTFAPVTNVVLRYRIQFGPEVAVPMRDDGAHGDGAAGDQIYGAIIPASASTNGQMIRYAIVAADNLGTPGREPLFNNPTDSDEYLGTVVMDSPPSTALPVFHWFVATPSLAETATGTRCSLFYNGELYDNIFVRIRGGTSRSWPKKSYKIELNEDHEFARIPGERRVTEFDWNTTYTDKSYLRSVLVYEHQRDAGLPSPVTFLAHLRQNSAFYSVTIYSEQPDKDFLRRVGLDEKGTFYKCGPGSTYDSVAGFEKKTRLTEGNTNVLALLQGLGLTGTNLEAFVFDNVDVPGMVNFMATVAVTQNIDASDKNHFLYQDTEGTREWRMLPWDQDLTFGPDALNTDTIVYNLQNTIAPACASHPFIGARPYMLHAAKYNRFLEAIVNVPRARAMLLRRTRTLTDQFIASGYFNRRIDELVPSIGPDVALDKARWGVNVSFGGNTHTLQHANDRIKTNYLAPRLPFLTGTSIVGVLTANPAPQPPNVAAQIFSVEFNPSSGNQAQEFIAVTNPAGFPLDLTGWRIDGGVNFAFAPGTVLTSNGVLYVAADVRAFRARTTAPRGGQGLLVVGNFDGRLSARGETLTLRDQYGQPAQTYRYPGNPSPAQQFLRITEIMYHPAPLAGNPNGAEEFEFVELKNTSTDTTINVSGVRWINGIEFNFTNSAVGNLGPGQSAVLVRNPAAFAARYGGGVTIAGVYSGSLENGGERLQLVDATGEEILDFSYDNRWYPITDGLGFSLVIADEQAEPDAWNRASQWRPSGRLDGSPTAADPGPPVIASIVINEALTRSDNPPPTDTIELRNPTAQSADIGGWYLSDDFNTPKKFRVPTGFTLGPGAYATFDESQFNIGPNAFALGSDGDEIWLFSADASGRLTGYVHGHRFAGADDGVSFGRVITSDGREHFVAQSTPTLGQPNAGLRTGPVIISEIHYHPLDLADGSDNGDDEFVELRNISGATVSLFDAGAATNTWRLSGGVNYQFPSGRSLASGASLLLVNFDSGNSALVEAFRARLGVPAGVAILGPLQGKLDNSGERIELSKPATPVAGNVPYVVVDEVEYQDSAPWPDGADGTGLSLQRTAVPGYGDEPATWVAAPVTAGSAGSGGVGRPLLVTGPTNQTAVAYQTIQFSVQVTGSGLRYQWRFKGSPLLNATNSLLILNRASPEQAGDYSVLAYNAAGSVVSSDATLSLVYPAFIVQQPSTTLVRVRPDPLAAPTTNATFRVSAYSPTELSYQWRFNGADIPGARASQLTVTNVQVADAGDYTVLVTDSAGSVLSAPASLIPLVSPVLVQAPVSQSAVPGAPIVLSAAVTGSPAPFGFEWRFGPTPLASNTVASPVGIFNVSAPITPFTTNTYRVVVRNLANVGLSANALVSIVALPDFDRDGLLDEYEVAIDLNTNNAADALGDLDGDRVRNIDEVVAGTDPLDPQSYLRIVNATIPGHAAIEFAAVSNRTYAVQFTDVLGSGWAVLQNVVARSSNRVERILDPSWSTNRAYRLAVPASPSQ